MTITFKSDKDVIVYALERIISYARDNQYIFRAQSIWWIASIIGLQEGLVIRIDNLKVRSDIGRTKRIPTPTADRDSFYTSKKEQSIPGHNIHPSRIDQIQGSEDSFIGTDTESISTTESEIHVEVIKTCELFMEQSKQERKAVGRKNRQLSRIDKKKAKKQKKERSFKTFRSQTEGMDDNELHHRKSAGECQCCAWPQDRKGGHKTLDCFRWKRLDKGTAPLTTK